MRVYKYMTRENFARSVVNGRLFLRASRMTDFNDPYEGSGVPFGTPSVSFAREWLANSLSGNDYQGKDDATVMVICQASMVGRFDLSEHFNDILRVISFSSTDIMKRPGADLLMWSHYAGSGTGVRIEFELDEGRIPLKRVQYSESRPKLDLSQVNHCDASHGGSFTEFLVDCVLTKPKIWEYESELRTVIILSHRPDGLCYATPLEQYKHISDQQFLIEVPNTCVKEIALGAKIGNVASAQDGMKEIRNNGFEHVKFSRAMFDDKYDYRYVNLFNE